MSNCFFEFLVIDSERFEVLMKVFEAIKAEKKNESIDSRDSKWLDYFDEEALSKFWWPTEKELSEYIKLWDETPFEKRFTDPRLQHGWDFESMIDSFKNGEYDLISCEKRTESLGRLEFYPWSWPYGGNGALKALIESFGFEITNEEG